MTIKNRIISLAMSVFIAGTIMPQNIEAATEYKQPYVIQTQPDAYDWLVDKSSLYKSFSNGQEGNYLTVTFDNINNDLKNSGVEIDDFDFFKEGDEGNSLLDEDRDIIYEGFKDNDIHREFTLKTSGRVDEIHNPYTSAQLYLNDNQYQENDVVKITLFDADLNQNRYRREEAEVQVTRGDETKQITLRETGNDTGQFEGEIEVWEPFDKYNQENKKINVRYIDLNSADMTTEKIITKSATVKDRVDKRRAAQIYIDKAVYEEDEKVNITVISQDENKHRDRVETLKVKGRSNIQKKSEDRVSSDDIEITLVETGKNTGIFKGSTKSLKGDFEIIYSHKYDESSILRNRAKIYIPIVSLEDGTIYQASIPEGLVYYDNTKISDKYQWTFRTSIASNTDPNFQGTVIEDYDERYPVTLKGDNYNKETKVYFKDISGREYQASTELVENREDILNVYLPRGRNRLKPGLYDIVIENNLDGKEIIDYGVFSVVESGKYYPEDNYIYNDKDIEGNTIREGELKKHTMTSQDTLELKSKYNDNSKLELDLDEIMGVDTWVRNISYRGYRNNTINQLVTKSRWADITLKDISLESYSGSRDMEISLGRAEPKVMEIIKKRLIGKSIKSDFIQISGSNYNISSADITIPYRESSGNNLEILRYDEQSRTIDRTYNFTVDKSNKKIKITNGKKGIYIVVE